MTFVIDSSEYQTQQLGKRFATKETERDFENGFYNGGKGGNIFDAAKKVAGDAVIGASHFVRDHLLSNDANNVNDVGTNFDIES